MRKVAFAYYRDWAEDILFEVLRLSEVRGDFEVVAVIVPKDRVEYGIESVPTDVIYRIDPNCSIELEDVLIGSEAEMILFYGWSWFIPSSIVLSKTCICLHPSKLPNFRGGSPIQNQVLSGVSESAVSIFRMHTGIDDGPIYKQGIISLLGPLEEVFQRIASIGKYLTKDLLSDFVNDEISFAPQEIGPCGELLRRRKAADSEISIKEVQRMTFDQLCRFVDVLRDPYPNAFIRIGLNTLLLTEVHKYNKLPPEAVVLSEDVRNLQEGIRYFLEVSDGFALISV